MLWSFSVLFSCCVVLCVGYTRNTECGSNQEKRCVHECPGEKTCKNRFLEVRCSAPAEPCETKCVCKKDFVRNAVADCITNEQCDKCPGDYEYFACDGACDNVCSTLQIQNKTNCPIRNIVCNKMCYCDDGYARDDKGNCVPIEKCQPTCPGENEVYTGCKKSCPPEACFSIVARFKCDSKELCTKGCVCKPGYLRKDEGSTCIPLCDCPEMRNSPDCKHELN